MFRLDEMNAVMRNLMIMMMVVVMMMMMEIAIKEIRY